VLLLLVIGGDADAKGEHERHRHRARRHGAAVPGKSDLRAPSQTMNSTLGAFAQL
jgi:hypothetical protein